MSTFVNKSQIRASFFPGPLSNGCSSWGSCGIFALGAQHSILLYKANTKCIDYLRAVEIQDGSNPTILEFHDKFPYLCIVTDNFTISIFDCVSGHFIGRTRQLGTKILAMKWYNNFIICFTQSNTLLSIDFFDQINGNNLHNINILNNNLNNNNNNNNNNSNNDINNDTGNYLSLSPIMVWNVEINENFTNIEIDPFSQTFQVLLYSTISNSFLIINSDSPMHQPMPPFQTQSMTGVSNIVDAVFHPHFKNVIIVLLPSSAIFYELQTKSLRTIISDLPSIFSRIFPSQSDSNELTIYCKDNSFMLFHARENDNTIFEKSSSTQLKREQMANPPPLLFAYNQHFMDYLIAVSAQYGIFMLCSNFLGQTKSTFLQNINPVISSHTSLNLSTENQQQITKRLIVVRSNLHIPMNVTCFDVSDNIQVFGTEFGCIHLINNVDGSVKSTFLVEENAKVCDVRVLSNNILYWSTTKYYGGIDISSNKVFTYENRSGSAIAVAYSEDIIVIQRDKFVVCVNDVKNLISKSRKPILSEKPFSFPIEIISICVQQKSTSSTISKFGDKPVFAVLLKNNQIHFFNIHSKEPIIRLRCPEDLPRPVSIAWKQNVFVTADWNGKFIFYDFEYGSSRLEATPFGNIKRVDFDKSENGLFIHSSVENKLGFFTDKVSVCKTQVSDFSTTGNGLVTVKTPFQTIVVLLLRDWSPLIKVASQSVVKPLDNYENRIIHIIDKIQNINQKENLNENTDMTNSDDLRKNDEFESVRNKISLGIENLEDQGLVFETKLLMVIQRYLYEYQKYKKSLDQITSSQEKYDDFKRSLSSSNFNSSIASKNHPNQNSPNGNECKAEKDNSIFLLPLKMANFAAGSSELHLCYQFKAELIRGCSDVHSALYAALLNLQINDIEGARECLLSVASSGNVNEFFPICALAASLLGSSIDKTAIGVLKGSSITLFDANDVQSALFLLTVGQMETFAVKILQERELWEESIILLSHLRDILFSDENICLSLTKLSSNASIQQLSSQQNLDLNEMNHINNKKSQEINLYESLNINLSESELKDLNNSVLNYKSHPEEIKDMIRQAAHNYLDHGDFEKSSLLFASLGDFLPVISIALAQKNYCLAYLLFIILESSGLINEYDKDTRFFNIQFDSPSFIERQVRNKYSKLISEKT